MHSGFKFISFTVTLVMLNLISYGLRWRLGADLVILAAAFICACVLRYLAIAARSRVPTESDIRVSLATKVSKLEPPASDDPIST